MARDHAPGDLRLVQELVNTVDREGGDEQLTHPAALARWCEERGLVPSGARATAADLRTTVEIREGLRALLYANNGEAVDHDAVGRLDARARDLTVRVAFDADGPRLEPTGSGVDAALARLLSIVERARVDGTWARLKACRRDAC